MYTRRIINCLGENCLDTSNSYSNSIANITTRTNNNIGLGISNPSYLLDVNGDIYSNTFITQNLLTTNISSQNVNVNLIFSTNISCSNITSSNFMSIHTNAGSTTFTNLLTTNSSINSINSNLGFFVNNTNTNLVVLSSSQSSLANISITNSTASHLNSTNMKVDGTMSSVNFSGIGAFPIGTIVIWSSNNIPIDYVQCNGNSYSRTGTYSRLFSVIGTSFGNVDSNTFNVPNLSGRVPVGFGTSGNTNLLGKTGGSEAITLGNTEMPSHNHSGFTGNSGINHTHTYQRTGADNGTVDGVRFSNVIPFAEQRQFGNTSETSGTGGNHSHTIGITGSGQPHNNIQPYIVLNYIIKFQ